jgi:ferric-dicitrate binding protein FerR (iron transport regulator)
VTNEYNIDDLLVKVVLGESTEGENHVVEQWISENPANERYFQDFQKIWTESRKLVIHSTVDEDLAWTQFKERVEEGQIVTMHAPPPPPGRQWLRVAAALLVVASACWLYYTHFDKPGQLLSVHSGSKVLLDTLPEGSVVTLNKGTAIHYQRRFSGPSREVEMEGEAFFSVAADEKKPFVVNANGVSITVLGTSFNVKTANGKTEVVVETGKVAVSAGGRTVQVNAREKAVISKDNAAPEKEANPDQLYNYYRTNAFECNGTPLWRLAEKLEEVYKVHIVIANDRLRNLQLTTTFVDESLDGILKIVEKTFAITYVRNGPEITLK